MTEASSFGKAKQSIGKAANGIGKFAREKSSRIAEQAEGVADSTKEFASETVEKLTTKAPDPYDVAVSEYNAAFTALNDKGLTLLRQRERSADLIEHVEQLVNSIANTPKSFAADFHEIDMERAQFLEAEEFALKDLEAARRSAAGAGAGLTAGAAVASIAPSVAMWVATTFGVASTGTAISTLSGAAASSAALAWLGGGTLAAGGGGTVAGAALLSMAGPVGWTVAGATLLASIALFSKKKSENRKAKHEALTSLKQNTALVRTLDVQIGEILIRTISLRELLSKTYGEALPFFGADFLTISSDNRSQLTALVNNTKACATQLSHRINEEGPSV